MKKNILRFTAFVGIALTLTACPYSSAVPISAPTEAINKDLLGKWIAASELSYDDPTYYSIEKLEKTRYRVVEFTYSSYDSSYSETAYSMHSSVVGDKLFVNIQEIAGGDFHLHRIDIGKDEFTLFEISENVDEKFNTSEELKAFIEKNMNFSFFYTKGEKKYVKK